MRGYFAECRGRPKLGRQAACEPWRCAFGKTQARRLHYTGGPKSGRIRRSRDSATRSSDPAQIRPTPTSMACWCYDCPHLLTSVAGDGGGLDTGSAHGTGKSSPKTPRRATSCSKVTLLWLSISVDFRTGINHQADRRSCATGSTPSIGVMNRDRLAFESMTKTTGTNWICAGIYRSQDYNRWHQSLGTQRLACRVGR